MTESLSDIVFEIGLMFIFLMLGTIAVIGLLSILLSPVVGGVLGALFFVFMSVIILWKAVTKLQRCKL